MIAAPMQSPTTLQHPTALAHLSLRRSASHRCGLLPAENFRDTLSRCGLDEVDSTTNLGTTAVGLAEMETTCAPVSEDGCFTDDE